MQLKIPYKQVLAIDYVSFKAMFQSVERNHAADVLEKFELDFLVGAATTPGAEGAFETYQEAVQEYRAVLGYADSREENGLNEMVRDFGRGL